jgi:hypothetical protein
MPNDLIDGFNAGLRLGNSFVEAMNEKERLKLAKDRMDLELALQNLKTGGGVGRINEVPVEGDRPAALSAIPLSPAEQKAMDAGKPLGDLQFFGKTYVNPTAMELSEDADLEKKLNYQTKLADAQFQHTVAGKRLDLDNQIRLLQEKALAAEAAGDKARKEGLENQITLLHERAKILGTTGTAGSSSKLKDSLIKDIKVAQYLFEKDPSSKNKLRLQKAQEAYDASLPGGEDLDQEAKALEEDEKYQTDLEAHNAEVAAYEKSWNPFKKKPGPPPVHPRSKVLSTEPPVSAPEAEPPASPTEKIYAPPSEAPVTNPADEELKAQLGVNDGIVITGEDIAKSAKDLGRTIVNIPKKVYDATGRKVAEAIGEDYAHAFPEKAELDFAKTLHAKMKRAGVDVSRADRGFININGKGTYYPNRDNGPITERQYIDTVSELANKHAKEIARQMNLERKASQTKQEGGIPEINSQEELDRLPSGAQFTWNGKTLRKK